MALNETQLGRWLSVPDAAAQLGLPERAIYRRVATQTMAARRDEQGALLVRIDLKGEIDRQQASESETDPSTSLTPDRARALAEFASGLVNPLVARMTQQEAIIREQAEELGRLRALAEMTAEADERLASPFTRQLAELAAIREEIERLANRPRWWPFG